MHAARKLRKVVTTSCSCHDVVYIWHAATLRSLWQGDRAHLGVGAAHTCHSAAHLWRLLLWPQQAVHRSVTLIQAFPGQQTCSISSIIVNNQLIRKLVQHQQETAEPTDRKCLTSGGCCCGDSRQHTGYPRCCSCSTVKARLLLASTMRNMGRRVKGSRSSGYSQLSSAPEEVGGLMQTPGQSGLQASPEPSATRDFR